jgi:hypothetical protein
MNFNPFPRNTPRMARQSHQRNSGRRYELSPVGIQAYRARMLQLCPQFTESHLMQFVEDCFASPETVMAYGCPLHLRVVVDVAGRPIAAEALPASHFQSRQTVAIIPFQTALQAAHQARDMKIIEDESDFIKRLTCLATLLSPCGLFLLNHPTLGPGGLLDETVAQAARSYQKKALGRAVAVLNERAPEAGKFLSFTLGFPFKGGVDGQRGAKMAAAITLSSLRLSNLWGTASLSLPRAPF